MATIAKHIRIAQEQGSEAGLRAYVAFLNSPLGLSNDKVAESRERLQACGNLTAAIPVYEELFLNDLIEDAAEQADEDWLTSLGTTAVVEKPKRTRKQAKKGGAITQLANEKPRTWNPYWVAKHGIPKKVGATFTYTSKKYRTTSEHRVESVKKDGSVITRRISLTRKGK